MQVKFGVWSVIETSVRVLFRNWLLFLGVGGIFYAPVLAISFATSHWTQESTAVSSGYTVGIVLGGLMYLIMPSLYAGAVVYAVYRLLSEERASLGSTIAKALRRAAPLVGVAIVAGVLVGLGTLLCIIPGVVVYTICWVAVPAMVVEGLGVPRALERSDELTKGYRARIFGIVCILVAYEIAVSVLAGFLVWAGDSTFGNVLISTLLQLLFGAMSGIASCVGYFALRASRESADEIPEGFLGRLWSSE